MGNSSGVSCSPLGWRFASFSSWRVVFTLGMSSYIRLGPIQLVRVFKLARCENSINISRLFTVDVAFLWDTGMK